MKKKHLKRFLLKKNAHRKKTFFFPTLGMTAGQKQIDEDSE